MRLAAIVFLLVIGSSGSLSQPSTPIDRLAADKGCYLCHRASPAPRTPERLLPYAPSWGEIANKYRGQADAEERLTQIVLQGSARNPKQLHWYGKVSDVGMSANVPEVNESDARELVRWILSFPPK